MPPLYLSFFLLRLPRKRHRIQTWRRWMCQGISELSFTPMHSVSILSHFCFMTFRLSQQACSLYGPDVLSITSRVVFKHLEALLEAVSHEFFCLQFEGQELLGFCEDFCEPKQFEIIYRRVCNRRWFGGCSLTCGWGFGWMTVFDRLVEMIPANVYLPKDNPTDQWVRFSMQFCFFTYIYILNSCSCYFTA